MPNDPVLGEISEEVERRWLRAEAMDADVAVCDQCHGPTLNVTSLLCRLCEGRDMRREVI